MISEINESVDEAININIDYADSIKELYFNADI